MKVCAVIVTYGDRFKYLSKVIDSVLKNKINKTIVVDNAYARNSSLKLQELAKSLAGKLKVIRLKRNIGSAGGFKKGIEEALKCKECDFWLLLDDDNVLSDGYINAVLNAYKKYNVNFKKENLLLFSNRVNLELTPSEANNGSFLGFTIKDLGKKLLRIIKGKYKPIPDGMDLPFAGWGGLFFHKSVVEKYGLPDDRLVLYYDDFEFTYRITSKGGKVFFVKDAKVIDLETSHGGESTKWKLLGYFYLNQVKVYYMLRNAAYFEIYCKKDNTIRRKTNKLFYMALLKIISLFVKRGKERYSLIKKAICYGEKGELGYFIGGNLDKKEQNDVYLL